MTADPAPRASAPIIIAHRGASGERPEHTLQAYDLAIDQGADFIEPDLVMTRDGELVARHENEIGKTTDVASRAEFAARRTTRTTDGRQVTGWFSEDFTLAELRTLRARERLPQLRPANAAYNGRFAIPTLSDVLALAGRKSKETGRTIGVYPELKHPSYFRSLGLPMEEALVAELERQGLRGRTAPVFIQCFEVSPLERLRQLTAVRLVQLLSDEGGPADRPDLSYRAMASPAGLKAIATYADGVGPAKALILPRDPAGRSLPPTHFIADAHRAGLAVHPWTFRAENLFLPAERRSTGGPAEAGDLAGEIAAFIALGIDGLFTDYPAKTVAALGRKGSAPSRD
jgi:glycerophosphoryl diester phosphodiesterase